MKVVDRITLDRVPSLPYPFPTTQVNLPLVHDVSLRRVPVTFEILKFQYFGDSYVNGAMIRELVKDMSGFAGWRHANLFHNQQTWLPRELWECILLFPGTEWRDPIGILHMPYLSLDHLGRVYPGTIDWLELDLCNRHRVVSICE